MTSLVHPEEWGNDKLEVLFGSHFNIMGNYLLRDTALCIERISTDTDGNWHFEIEIKDENKSPQKTSFNTFISLIEFMEA